MYKIKYNKENNEIYILFYLIHFNLQILRKLLI